MEEFLPLRHKNTLSTEKRTVRLQRIGAYTQFPVAFVIAVFFSVMCHNDEFKLCMRSEVTEITDCVCGAMVAPMVGFGGPFCVRAATLLQSP